MKQTFFLTVQKIHDGIFRKILGRWLDRIGISPNGISVIRIILTPFVFAAWVLHNFIGALIIFAVAAWCDMLDGAHARTSERFSCSGIGKVLDPIADKLLILCAIYTVGFDYLHFVITNAIAILEGSIALLGFLILRHKTFSSSEQESLIQAKPQGKAKMVLEVISMVLLFCYDAFGEKFASALKQIFETILHIYNLHVVTLAQLLMLMAIFYAIFSLREHFLQFIALKNTKANPAA